MAKVYRDDDELRDKERELDETEGDVFYRSHPAAAPMDRGLTAGDSFALTVEKIIWWITGIVEIILLARLIIAAFGATGGNPLTALIYSVSNPLVAPFFGLFGSPNTPVSAPRFEFETLVAMVVYYIIAYIVVQLIDLFRGREV